MRRLLVAFAAILALVPRGSAVAQDYDKGRWIDLTHPFSSETIYWPTANTFEHETVFQGYTDNGYYYTAYNFKAAEHGGTHLDAPIHFFEGKWTADQIPIDRLIAPAIVVDVAERAGRNRDYQVSVADFVAWEKTHGRIPDHCIVLLNTGSARHWPNRVEYMGTDKLGDDGVAELHFPGLHPDAAKWLVKNRTINAIGLDTPSIDYGPSTLFESHRILFEKNIPAFENVANLDELPATGATVFALPMKIEGGSGGPLRIVAFVAEK